MSTERAEGCLASAPSEPLVELSREARSLPTRVVGGWLWANDREEPGQGSGRSGEEWSSERSSPSSREATDENDK